MESSIETISKLMSKTYVKQSLEALSSREKQIQILLEQRKCPEDGWDDLTIELLLQRLALMDSNNFMNNCGVGEREARIEYHKVAERHYHFGHGIGRSGDLNEVQPKAAGSSLLNILANRLVLDIFRNCGIPNTKSCFIVPMATGMSLTLCMLTLRHRRPKARYVIWSRIDQKSCFKSILTAGFEAVVVENKLIKDSLETDVDEIEKQVKILGADNIVCILSTTSSFAPKVPDNIEQVSMICKRNEIPHVVNNAYGLQSTKCMHLIEQSSRNGRIDAFVQSCDKNFLVPVGGSVIAGFDENFIGEISKNYPGRASSTPTLDVLMTLLHLGLNGYKRLLEQRKQLLTYFRTELETLAEKYGERVLQTKSNHISIGLTLNNFQLNGKTTEIGSMLFLRGVSGARVVTSPGTVKQIGGHNFVNWGSHHNNYPNSYLTAAVAIGITKEEIDVFLKRLTKLFTSLKIVIKNENKSIFELNCFGNAAKTPQSLVTSEAFSAEIHRQYFGNAFTAKDEIEYEASVVGKPDLPHWMFFRNVNSTEKAFLYGSPETVGDFDIEIIAMNKHSYDTFKHTMNFRVIPRESKLSQTYEVELKFTNLNIEEMYDDTKTRALLEIFKQRLWIGSDDVYITLIAAPLDVGGRLPVDPNDKEGVVIRIGSTDEFTQDLLDLRRETDQIKNRNPCPRKYKATTAQYLFREKDFYPDWCAFRLITPNTESSTEPGETTTQFYATHPLSEMDDEYTFKTTFPTRDYTLDVMYSFIIPSIIGIMIVSSLSCLLFYRENLEKNVQQVFTVINYVRNQMEKYNSIQRASVQLQQLGKNRNNLPSSSYSSLQRPTNQIITS
ncbi:O-phosphoseryl-tRNA(Sec) selenium transferase-like protein [Leptotrombidium deliense]|uniref:O-phosphoseryl-tRNA(Sec) selenium transferase n=1 Tax=Leptotrombidium deliense TaxID=299467 RepID=A0A443SS15_9ACAR|nr:O-phosphoseryl-tRNA(Sec) selenium transferase-like protein [Leptotrombidium deliense]